MRVKAKVSFGGQYAMYKDDVNDIPDNPVTRSLIESGFIEETMEAPEEAPEEEPDPAPAVNLRALRKEDLIKICEEKGIKADRKATKEELIAAIEEQE